jgi:hypothetical protein
VHKFNTAQLIVPDTGIYLNEINKIKAMGVPNVIVDIEQPIWAGGNQAGTPIGNFANYFQQLKSIGVTRVSSEGGRDGDLDFIGKYFQYVNYNCDQCGLWKDFYKHPATVMNSWESYYTWEWDSIKIGVQQAAPLGKKNGILAGVWGVSENPILGATQKNDGSGLTYYDEAKWIDANGGLDHFAVWGGLNPYMLGRYRSNGFEPIVAKMQSMYPPRGSVSPPATITFKDVVTTPNCLDEFAWGSDNACWHKPFGGAWESLQGIITSAPAAISRPGGLVDVFVRGEDSALWQRSYTGGAWGRDWKPLYGLIYTGTSPSVCSRDGVTLDVMVLGTDKASYRKTFNGTAWSHWKGEDRTIRA